VPGSNVGGAGSENDDDGGGVDSAVGVSPLPSSRLTNRTTPNTATSATIARPMTHPPPPRPVDGGSGGAITPELLTVVGARTGECCTATPGPAGVVTSDQLIPFHQRTCPGAPSGSGYQPGGGALSPGPLTPAL
jgi:hypothetical protein